MKRNNIFMWAYITFIGICIIARIIGDFPLWQPIVLAITISSAFFAFEDLYSSRSRYLRDSCSIAENFIAEAKKRNNDHLLFFAKLSEASKRYKGTANDVGTIEDAFGPVKEQTEALSGYIKELEAKTTAKQKKQVEYHRIASIFAFLGFLCLFCTMAFAPHMDLANVQQEGLSVFSFAVILLTQ